MPFPAKKRLPSETARLILDFPMEQGGPQTPGNPLTFSGSLTGIIESGQIDMNFEPTEEAPPPMNTPMANAWFKAGDFKEMVSALEKIAGRKKEALTHTEKAALRDAPELMQVLAEHSRDMAQHIQDEAAGHIAEPMLALHEKHFGHEHVRSGLLQESRSFQQQAGNVENHILPLFKELADSLGFSLNSVSPSPLP